MTQKEKEIMVTEHTLKDIFRRDVITDEDVSFSNSLFDKLKILKREGEENILDEKPEYQIKN